MKDNCINNFKKAANDLAKEVNKQLFEGYRDWYWISDMYDVCDFDDVDIINISDMVLILEHNLTYDQYAEWRNANLDNDKYINLRSWLMGARHHLLTTKIEQTKQND